MIPPGWQRYSGRPWTTPRGRVVWIYRKGQRVRFFDAAGRQVGPEQSNVAPGVSYAHYKGWRT